MNPGCEKIIHVSDLVRMSLITGAADIFMTMRASGGFTQQSIARGAIAVRLEGWKIGLDSPLEIWTRFQVLRTKLYITILASHFPRGEGGEKARMFTKNMFAGQLLRIT